MATIYRAYANGEEITDFPINGVETKEIWGGDTLLWKKTESSAKELLRIFSRFTGYDSDKNPYVCEYGISLMNQSEDGKYSITEFGKAGVSPKSTTGSMPPWSSYGAYAYLLFEATFSSIYAPSFGKFFKRTWKQWDKNGELVYENENYTYIGVGKDQYKGYYSYLSGFGTGEDTYNGLNAFLVEANFPNLEASSAFYRKDTYVEYVGTFSTPQKLIDYVMS